MKVSVIVPVYRAEEFIDRCVESIVNQTYEDLEIILVDDGSPDNSGKMCDDWAKKDSRILVRHKENGGQAEARNIALDIATGDYVVFIDSDDYVSCDYVEKLLTACQQTDSDIAVCAIMRVFKDGSPLRPREYALCKPGVYDDISYVIRHIYFSPCNKIYKRELFDGTRFEKGIQFEDFALMPIVISKAKRVNILEDFLYFYTYNENSTLLSKFYVKKINFDILKAFDVLAKSRLSKMPEVLENLYIRYILISLAWKIAEFGDESVKSVKDLVAEGLNMFPNMATNSDINLFGKINVVFLKLVLTKHFTLAKLYVRGIAFAKSIYRRVRDLCR